MRTAADLEDGSEKHVAMENRLWPMRELLGDMLLAANKADLALEEYEASLQSARSRYRGFYGAAKAAQSSGDQEKAMPTRSDQSLPKHRNIWRRSDAEILPVAAYERFWPS
jgi:hypothetical protein